jgi:hypothetical protein
MIALLTLVMGMGARMRDQEHEGGTQEEPDSKSALTPWEKGKTIPKWNQTVTT